MELILSVLSKQSAPVSKLSAADELIGSDCFLVARRQEQEDDDALITHDTRFFYGESDDCVLGYYNKYEDPVDEKLAEFGITKSNMIYPEARELMKRILADGWKLHYRDLSGQLLTDISARLGLKSMAYKDEWEYSRRNHSHKYSTVECRSVLTYEQVKAQYSDPKQCTGPYDIPEYLGTVEIQREAGDDYVYVSSDIYAPHVENPDYPEPDVGEVRLIALGRFPHMDPSIHQLALTCIPAEGGSATSQYQDPPDGDALYDSRNGGYWIYPKGQRMNVKADEFKKASVIYGVNHKETDTVLVIPMISGFTSINNGSERNDPIKKLQAQHGLIEHTHELDNDSLQSSENTLTANIKLPSCPGSDRSQTRDSLHSGTSNMKNAKLINLMSADISFQNIKSQPCNTDYDGNSVETQPKHMYIPAMMYIGRQYE